VSASTQNQALNAIVFLYKHILRKEPGEIKAVRAKPHKLPVVLSQPKARRVPDATRDVARRVIRAPYAGRV